MIKLCIDHNGYLFTMLYNDQKQRKFCFVHRVVAATFLQNPNSYPVVNHKNGVKIDNRVENLEYCTASENTKHGFKKLGRRGVLGENNGKSKLTEVDVINIITLLDQSINCTKRSKQFGVAPTIIQRIKNGELWTHIPRPQVKFNTYQHWHG